MRNPSGSLRSWPTVTTCSTKWPPPSILFTFSNSVHLAFAHFFAFFCLEYPHIFSWPISPCGEKHTDIKPCGIPLWEVLLPVGWSSSVPGPWWAYRNPKVYWWDAPHFLPWGPHLWSHPLFQGCGCPGHTASVLSYWTFSSFPIQPSTPCHTEKQIPCSLPGHTATLPRAPQQPAQRPTVRLLWGKKASFPARDRGSNSGSNS